MDDHYLTLKDRAIKRLFDMCLATLLLALTFGLILAAFVAASVDTRQNGLFLQRRVGRKGKLFTLFKLRTMRGGGLRDATVTVAGDKRITRLGSFFRRSKMDELPQLLNVLIGQMSFVGPRPDVPGYADRLLGDDRIILTVRPGITGPATLKYRSEECLLGNVPDPGKYNDEVVYPDKVAINRHYLRHYSFVNDLKYIAETIIGKQ